MLAIAREKSVTESRRVRFVEADALHLPFGDASLDAVTSAFGFRNLASYDCGIREMRRVLKRGGRIAILEFSQVCWPVFGPLFRFYFRRILPRIGAWISGAEGPYSYLPDSVAQFPASGTPGGEVSGRGFHQGELCELYRRCGGSSHR